MRRVLQVAALLLAAELRAAGACDARCACRGDSVACAPAPFHRLAGSPPHARHLALAGAALGSLPALALDGRRLATLALVAARLHHIEPQAFAPMVSTLASLDLGYNEFTAVPLESIRGLRALNWLNLQNNYISDLQPNEEWGSLADSLSSLSLSNNQLTAVPQGALAALRRLAQLDLEGNRLHSLAGDSLPAGLALLRLSDNLLREPPCAALATALRLRHLHLRNNVLRKPDDRACLGELAKYESLDLSHNELDDTFRLELRPRARLKRLVLDFNEFTSVPSFVADGSNLERLSIAYNRVRHVSETALRTLRTVERLELDHNELRALPAGVAELLRMRHLSLAYNELREVAALPPRLRSLSLAGNYLMSLPPALSALDAGALSHLDVGYNSLSALDAELQGAWASALISLDFRGNELTVIAPDAFPATLPLQELLLSFTEMDDGEVVALGELRGLRVLELSTAVLGGTFPLPATSLPALTWLRLDNNRIQRVTADDLLGFPLLEYLNLDFNKIVEFPITSWPVNASSHLKELKLSYNYISKVNFEFFAVLEDLQSLDISYNRLGNISKHSFTNSANLVYLNLAGNTIEWIDERSFVSLPRLEVLELQHNRLAQFSVRYFEDVSAEDTDLTVNVSNNRIASLIGGGPPLFVNVLDLSYNLLEGLSKSFFDSLGPFVRQIDLSHNRVTHVDNEVFALTVGLQVLSLRGNSIGIVKRRAFGDASALQILDLSYNRLAQLYAEQFTSLRHLRHLRLDSNKLRLLPRDVFRNTVLEHLDLSDNRFSVFPSSALSQVGFTMRRLELAGNRLEYLDAAALQATAFLHELGLARNALTVLGDSTFGSLVRLTRLDLSHNPVKANFRELLHGAPGLRRLTLSNAALRAVPPLPLDELTDLDLADNHIESLREADLRRARSLRSLSLAGNALTSLQPAAWAVLPRLLSLDLSRNPLVRIAGSSFSGLDRLQSLRLEHLTRLETIDPRTFRSLRSLRSLAIDSSPGEAAVAQAASSPPALESLELEVRGVMFDSQLARLHAPKLRALDIRGPELRTVRAGALAALGGVRALRLRFAGTAVRSLPVGLLRPLTRVQHLALQLEGEALEPPEVSSLGGAAGEWRRRGTRFLSGGLQVSGGALACGCGAARLGAWLRRWAAESGGGGAGAVRAGECTASDGARVPLVALEDAGACGASALSSRARGTPAPRAVAHSLLGLSVALLLTLHLTL